MKKEVTKLIKQAVQGIEKQFGKGAIMQLGEGAQPTQIETVSSGSLKLDRALGIGGLPKGRLVEIYGPESSGKTTMALHAIAETQKKDLVCAFIDAEHALDIQYAQKLGVCAETLLLAQPDYGEQALEIADKLISSGAVRLIVIDSVAALIPKAELDGEVGDIHVGLQARLMSQAMRKLAGAAYRHGVTLLFINQTRQKIGVTYGSNITTTGGNALKFYASVRLEVARIGRIKNGDEVIGNQTRIKVVKNKLAPPFRQVEFEIIYGQGVNQQAELLDEALDAGHVTKSGSWYAMGDEKLGQGRQAACQWIIEHPEQTKQLQESLFTNDSSTSKTPAESDTKPSEAAPLPLAA